MIATNPTDIKKIICDPNSAETLVKTAEQIGAGLAADKLSTGQIRALFGEVRQIEGQWGIDGENRRKALRRLILLKPKMAYRARKERGQAVSELVAVLEPALDEVIGIQDVDQQNAAFARFIEFFEAILAYHKSHGGD